jgi:hypothetical protein
MRPGNRAAIRTSETNLTPRRNEQISFKTSDFMRILLRFKTAEGGLTEKPRCFRSEFIQKSGILT